MMDSLIIPFVLDRIAVLHNYDISNISFVKL